MKFYVLRSLKNFFFLFKVKKRVFTFKLNKLELYVSDVAGSSFVKQLCPTSY